MDGYLPVRSVEQECWLAPSNGASPGEPDAENHLRLAELEVPDDLVRVPMCITEHVCGDAQLCRFRQACLLAESEGELVEAVENVEESERWEMVHVQQEEFTIGNQG